MIAGPPKLTTTQLDSKAPGEKPAPGLDGSLLDNRKKEYAMTVLIITIIVAWLVFSTLMVTIICMNSSRLSRIDEPFKDPAQVARARRRKREELAKAQGTGLPISAES